MGGTATEVWGYPIAPDVPLPLLVRLKALKEFHTGSAVIGAAGGPVTMVRFGPPGLLAPFAVITSPQGARDVLGATNGAFDKEGLAHVESRVLGSNSFSMAHDPWVPRRRTLQPLFTKKHVADFSGGIAGVADALSAEWIDAGTVDLDRECRRLTLRVLGRSLFGLDLGDRAEELGPPIRRSLQWITARATRPVRSPAWLPTPARHRLRTSAATVRATIDDAIAAARADPGSSAELIHLLLRAANPDTGRPLTDAEIGDELTAFLVAGHDTTATTLTFSLWALAREPELQERVAAEAAETGDAPLVAGDLPRLPLTTRVVHEALRLCPPAPIVTRLAMRDAVVDGFRIPAGTNAIVGIYAMHRDPELWDDPETFDPDRFTDERSAGRSRWQYLPFGGGPRTCIGDHFAMLEATIGLACVLRAARFSNVAPDFPLALPFTMTAGGPIPARVTARGARTPAPPPGPRAAG